jgi:tetratricopeptide (TPR) repeat protein
LQEYKEVVKADPTFFTISPKLGEKYRYINIVEATIRDLQQQLKTDPNNISALKSMGRIFYHLGKYSQARQMFEKVTRLKPGEKEATWYLQKMNKI